VGRPRDPASTEYLYVTVWEDVESIRAFAGEALAAGRDHPDEEHLLRDTWIGHDEVLPTPTWSRAGIPRRAAGMRPGLSGPITACSRRSETTSQLVI
jgi:hypothetical protein